MDSTRPHILLVHKVSRYEHVVLDGQDSHVQDLIAQQDVSVARLKRSHDMHNKTLDQVQGTLERLGLDVTLAAVGDDLPDVSKFDLAVSVGGDGTVLNLSHSTAHTPVLAINSDPEGSVGYFCAGEGEDIAQLMDDILEQRLHPDNLLRFCIIINEHRRTTPVLNDVLVCHANPAAVTSYILRIDEQEEAQRSSGLWISTPAGSTGATRSAGGLVMPLHSKNLQYLVREPYPPKNGAYRLLRGIRPAHTPVEIVSKTYDGRIFLDGPHNCYTFALGDRLRIDPDAPPLRIYGMNKRQRNA